MKTIKMLSVALIVLFAQMSVVAQNAAMHQNHHTVKATITTTTFKVWGNCDMCKTRIETAAKAAGATKANWSDKTKMLSVSYDASKVKLMDIHKKIAAAGHDTDKANAADKTYKALPGCCQYERGK
ncbi:MAG: cation-transporting ATPase [Bacteroidota bacterium]|nr:cation-transporting ATPase [Bacteroidota bacterium]